ncbi:MAG: LysE family transporter [Pseudomonadota bacterium]
MIELLTVISITIIAAVVPGPDFVVVLRNTISGGRMAGLMTAAGVALAVSMHAAYAIAGIALLVSQSIFLFSALKLAGAAYLIFLGFTMWKQASPELPQSRAAAMPPWRALRWGFLTNATNPKATLFAMSVFLQVTSPETMLATKIGYGIIMAGGVFVWFALVTLFFTLPSVRNAFRRIKQRLEQTFGLALLAFGVGIAATTGTNR